MVNNEKKQEYLESKQPETATSKFWRDIEKTANDLIKQTPGDKVKEWWGNIAKAADEGRITDDSDSGNTEAEQTETKEQLMDEYYEDLKNNSECPETIEKGDSSWEKITPEENAQKRKEFDANRGKIIKEWEGKNGMEWPRYQDDVIGKYGQVVRKAGQPYEAHHIKPLSYGGKNEGSNITPLHYSVHNDHSGVHSKTSPYGRINEWRSEMI